MATKTNQSSFGTVEVSGVVSTEGKSSVKGYPNGGSFDTADGSAYPITLDPNETIEHILLSMVGGEVDVEITTTNGNVVTIPVDSKSTIDSYSSSKVVIRDGGSTPRVAGGWAGA